MILLSAAESRELDRLTQEGGVASYTLMTRAGETIARTAARHFGNELAGGVVVVAGKGNNGGDGLVAARALRASGERVRAVLLARKADLAGDAARACADYVGAGGPLIEVTEEAEAGEAIAAEAPALLIDAIFGTGLKAEVKGLARRAIEAINALRVAVLSVDIASGVDSDTGAVMGAAVKAALTITFGFAKYGHASYPGAEFSGALEIADIGFAASALEQIAPRGRLLERADAAPLIRARPVDSHKGNYGHPLIVAGGRGKSGAAILAARAALRSGAGLVTAAIPAAVAGIVANAQAELMTEPMPERGGFFEVRGTIERLSSLIEGKSAVVAGPGIGTGDDNRDLVTWLVAEAARPARPVLLDADALTVLAQLGIAILKSIRGPIVLTPHPGEMARLLNSNNAAINANRIGAARRLADVTGANVLLKGARTVIATPDKSVCINSTGNPGMATPGMGDVLSGMIGALMGQGLTPAEALRLGALLHGHAADRVAARIAPVGYLAGDLIDEIPAARQALIASKEL